MVNNGMILPIIRRLLYLILTISVLQVWPKVQDSIKLLLLVKTLEDTLV